MNLQLKSERLLIRPFDLADGPEVERLCGDWDIAKMLARVPHPYPRGLGTSWIKSHDALRKNDKEFPFAITKGGTLIGSTGVTRRGPTSGEVGYWIAKTHWGQGFATEATRSMLQFAYWELGLNEVVAGYYSDNPASGRVLRKLGFRYTGTQKHWCEARQNAVDHKNMVLEFKCKKQNHELVNLSA